MYNSNISMLPRRLHFLRLRLLIQLLIMLHQLIHIPRTLPRHHIMRTTSIENPISTHQYTPLKSWHHALSSLGTKEERLRTQETADLLTCCHYCSDINSDRKQPAQSSPYVEYSSLQTFPAYRYTSQEASRFLRVAHRRWGARLCRRRLRGGWLLGQRRSLSVPQDFN